ncbi:polysaccharide biosynthesis/export family protein [Novosphingobium sp. Leaf2]|uniref:polysaccharide biosynthesis/export family protein n=1 Tax=Novosphingobium sp. Leaf2 TaxID=1735670 RepID=UPI0006F23B19|nr:polysaccharide biosynthesis/export family protein [Novosphingobium sp. Leaf2]KQM18282.1 capsule biosynthesis protein [Novosphingobium sp. Leaf2]
MKHSKFLSVLSAAGLLSACASLPSSGPTGSQILKDAARPEHPLDVVEVVDATELPTAPAAATMPLPDLQPPPTDMIGPGDVLEISIYETGVALFGGGQSGTAATPAFDPSARAHTLPPSRVNDNGDIVIPYAGRLHVVGKTIAEVQDQIRRSLRGLTQNPQVLVTPRDVITNSVIISGEVAKPGRLVLQTNRETLSDVVALAGGYRGKANELSLRVVRGQRTAELRVSDLLENPALDVRAYPGDRVSLISDPRTFSILGSPGRADQLSFTRSTMSLAEAVASAGGTNPSLGDPSAIFVFRYVPDATGGTKPVVYHINMMKAGSYFLSQHFIMRDKDVLYFGNARANQPSKVIQLVSQLFAPILTVTSAVQTVQNSSN